MSYQVIFFNIFWKNQAYYPHIFNTSDHRLLAKFTTLDIFTQCVILRLTKRIQRWWPREQLWNNARIYSNNGIKPISLPESDESIYEQSVFGEDTKNTPENEV